MDPVPSRVKHGTLSVTPTPTLTFRRDFDFVFTAVLGGCLSEGEGGKGGGGYGPSVPGEAPFQTRAPGCGGLGSVKSFNNGLLLTGFSPEPSLPL